MSRNETCFPPSEGSHSELGVRRRVRALHVLSRMGFRFGSVILTVVCLLAPFAHAERIHLYEWHSGQTLAPLILPVRESETPRQAAERYLYEMTKSPELMELFLGRTPDLPLDGFRPLREDSREKRALMIANNPKAMTSRYAPLENLIGLFARNGNTSYVMPVTANLGLSHTESRDFFQQVSEKFPLLVPMGGDDVDPHFYKEENLHSKNVNAVRDLFEIQLIKHYAAQAKGFILGICRGSQLTAVALGYKLMQDVPLLKGTHTAHGNDWHSIETRATTHGLLRSMAGPDGRLQVNSLHHQAVLYHEGGPLEIAARAHDGITEATEFKNGRGLLLQFHPELMGDELGERILRRVVQQKDRVMAPSCSKAWGLL